MTTTTHGSVTNGRHAPHSLDGQPPIRIGVIGSGYASRHFVLELERRPAYRLGKVLTRRPLDACAGFPFPDALTHALDAVIEASDVVLECSGDAAATSTVPTAGAAFRSTPGKSTARTK